MDKVLRPTSQCPDPNGQTLSHQTGTKTFTVTLAVEDDCQLECTLWDKDDATPQNFLGEIVSKKFHFVSCPSHDPAGA